jgi:hypothetical protein
MKSSSLLLIVALFQVILGTSSLFAQQTVAQPGIPALNEQIIAFVNSKLKKKVGRGECWDLAAEALNQAGATWDGNMGFGQVVDPKTGVIYPGDIIQFEKVQVKYTVGNMNFAESYPHHTAVVYKVLADGSYEIAQQNTSETGQKVGIGKLDLKTVTKGQLTFFRPVK